MSIARWLDVARSDPSSRTRLEDSSIRVGEPADHLVIELWREGNELKRMTRN